ASNSVYFHINLTKTDREHPLDTGLSWQLKLTDPIRHFKKESQKAIQDGDEAQAPSPASEGLPDQDLTSSRYPDEPMTERRLHMMLQDLRHTLQKGLKELTAEMRKDLDEIGDRTNHLENRAKELCAAHNEVVDKIQRLAAVHKLLKHKMANMEDSYNVRFRGITDTIPNEELPTYLKTLRRAIVPGLEDSAWIWIMPIDCPVHRASQPIPRKTLSSPFTISSSRTYLFRLH
ncbi:Hypothetical predicted protein, partial [Pelobates cultripes]